MVTKTLAQRLAEEFANSAPEFQDPEEDLDANSAKVTLGAVDENVDDDKTRSSLRGKNVPLLSDQDKKYAGKTVSRKSLNSLWSEDESDDKSSGNESDIGADEKTSLLGGFGGDYSYDDDSDEEKAGNADDVKPNRSKQSKTIDKEDDNEISDLEGDDDDDDDDEASDEEDDDEEDNDDLDDSMYNLDLSSFVQKSKAGLKTEMEVCEDDEESDDMSAGKISSQSQDEVKRGLAVQNQIKMWESLLELRIELQKILNAANVLPQCDLWNQLTAGSVEETQRLPAKDLEEVQTCCKELLEEFMSLQDALEDSQTVSGSKRSASDLNATITKRFKPSLEKHNETIQKWDEKTRLNVVISKRKRQESVPQTTLKQIQHVLADKNRLIQRTRVRRANLQIIGKPSPELVKQDEGNREEQINNKATHLSQDPEIFNDDDFYHQLLRELIEQKTNNSDDPIAISRQWLEFQAMRKKIKRTVDTRASKGRKLRYNVMPKLVNFMAPILSAEEWDDEKKDELFSSLFGNKPKSQYMNAEASEIVILR